MGSKFILVCLGTITELFLRWSRIEQQLLWVLLFSACLCFELLQQLRMGRKFILICLGTIAKFVLCRG